MRYIALFETRIYIMKYVKYLYNKGVTSEIRAAPRILSKSCVSAVYFNYGQEIQELVTPDVSKIYRVEGKDYRLVYTKK